MSTPQLWAKWALSKTNWIQPKIYPLFLVVASGLGMSSFLIGRNLFINPDIRMNKDDREAGVLKNHKEGKLYYDHRFRAYMKSYAPTYYTNYPKS